MDDVDDARVLVREAGLEILCTQDDCDGELRDGRVAYGWHPDPAVRNARILRALNRAQRVAPKSERLPESRP